MFIIALFAQAQAQDVAITEFINDSLGAEPAAEWVELFNPTPNPVDLTDYAIADEDSDFSLIPAGTMIPAGGFLILANDPIQFVSDWGVGTAGLNVIPVSMTIANTSDELVLLDPTGLRVSALAYSDDETPGFSTWQTDPGLMVPFHGDKVLPGVNRAGDDNGMVGYLGFEDGSNTPDPFAIPALNGDFGSPLAGPYGAPPPVAPALSMGGSCPGIVDMIGENLTPSGQIALLTANGPGNTALPGGPCLGEVTGLDGGSMVFRGTFNVNGNGDVTLSPNLPAPACGMAVQLLDLGTCELTNVALIP